MSSCRDHQKRSSQSENSHFSSIRLVSIEIPSEREVSQISRVTALRSDATIDDVSVSVVHDTGAEVSCIDEKVFKQLSQQNKRQDQLVAASAKLQVQVQSASWEYRSNKWIRRHDERFIQSTDE